MHTRELRLAFTALCDRQRERGVHTLSGRGIRYPFDAAPDATGTGPVVQTLAPPRTGNSRACSPHPA
jgi:hypothetical protein